MTVSVLSEHNGSFYLTVPSWGINCVSTLLDERFVHSVSTAIYNIPSCMLELIAAF